MNMGIHRGDHVCFLKLNEVDALYIHSSELSDGVFTELCIYILINLRNCIGKF